ncbi:MAG: gluconeogenesis factor YvcK family protein [Microthrixaceae bacterium]
MTAPVHAPRVVAIGGGHGLAVTLRAVAGWASHVTAVVSTADDGGSTGRLRESWDVPALGDVRRCLSALADPDDVWTRVLERRFDAGELAGHAVGNLVLLALTEELGDLQSACDEVARGFRIDRHRARVVPVTDDAIVLHGRTIHGAVVEGQVAVANTAELAEVWVAPSCTAASPLSIEAIRAADLVVLGPGSLYTSVLAAAVVGDIRKALADVMVPVAYIANLRADTTETAGYDLASHLDALHRHGVHPDVTLLQPGSLPRGELDTRVVEADVATPNGLLHDPHKLGAAIRALVR